MTQLERAEVVDVEDPEGRGRLQVSFAGRARSRRQAWAEVCLPLGADAGRPPAVGETVLVGHEGRGTGSPVVLGRLGPPVETPRAEQPTELRLTHAGHSVVIDEDGITLRLADGSAELVLTTAGVTLRAGATLRLEGGAATTLRSSGTCEVTGSLVRIN
ncbi:phage baseplate assembly protein V [Ornithinimicrobium sp. W1665]|uniref:phage baseplate assembly protein V n=1 Tax=Ornithinimicrobium sp. W1665 TaxID=3416666 RepID=UPI003CF55DBD